MLVHGAWHGAWCWEKVAPLLEEAGHEAVVFDLPGHGEDRTPVSEVSLRAYAERVCQALDEGDEPAVLVGHSMGGAVISEAAESRPEGIEVLVYLTAFLLPSGKTLLDYHQADEESVVLHNLVVREDEGVAVVREEALVEAFYADCPEEDAERAIARLVPQPAAPFATPVEVTEAFGRVPRVYVECLHDRAITPQTQKKMYTGLPCREVVSLQTDHSPFFSAPQELAERLASIATGG